MANQHTLQESVASQEERREVDCNMQQINSSPLKDSSLATDRKESAPLDAELVARQIDSMFLDSLAGTDMSPSSTLDDSSGHESGQHSLIAEELALLYESSAGSSLDRDFCEPHSASENTLRRLRLDTCRDVAVCEQQRKSVDLARRVFSGLERRDSGVSNRCQEGEEDGEQRIGTEEEAALEETETEKEEAREEVAYDIKLVRRAGSSASSSNFRQTLVCSVSPLGDHRAASRLDSSGTNTTNSTVCLQHPLYPIDGPEIQQCRTAFRENRRLIEEVQEQVRALALSQKRPNSCPLGTLPTTSTPNTNNSNTDWLDRFKREHARACKQVCSHCRDRLYPVDKLELDFTKLTLAFHRNCFRCQVCSTLLRLETYASIDGKLYCPSHVKQAAIPVSR